MTTRPRFFVWLTLALTVSLASCTFYFGEGDDGGDDVACGGEAPRRDPQTNGCFAGYPCDVPVSGGGATEPQSDAAWAGGACQSACTGLTEEACLTTPGCQGAYFVDGETSVFDSCWSTGAVGWQPVECAGLDAYSCAMYDSCTIHYDDGSAWGSGQRFLPAYQFESCQNEATGRGCYSDQECGPGFDCTADTECLPPPGCDGTEACPAVCYGRCVPSQACGDTACPLGTHCEETCAIPFDGMADACTPEVCDCPLTCVQDSACFPGTCPEGSDCVQVCSDGGPTQGGGSDPNNGSGDAEAPCFDANGDGICDDWVPGCWIECIPRQDVCQNVDCGPGYFCAQECAPGPSGEPACWPVCQPEGPNDCEAAACQPGTHCELQCYPCDPIPGEPNSCGDTCDAFCVPDWPQTCDTVDCGTGAHCEILCTDGMGGGGDVISCAPVCVSDGGTCAATTCEAGTHCEELQPPCLPNNPCPGPQPVCVPNVIDPGSCFEAALCNTPSPTCPDGTVAGVRNGCWTGYCIPDDACALDPGVCEALAGGICDLTAPPQCPAATSPGVRDCHYTGFCIPDSQCVAGVACEALSSELGCLARTDCDAIYSGEDCKCTPDGGCFCSTQTFARCQTAD